jgi:hypothetical protein
LPLSDGRANRRLGRKRSLRELAATAVPGDDHPIDERDLIEYFPRLFHMADVRAWPTIERLGLRSTTSLLDELGVDGDLRHRLEAQRRPVETAFDSPVMGRVVIRDQKPLNTGKLAACLTDMTVDEWLRLLNRKVFFWPHQKRVEELLGAKAYRDRAHLVLTVDTASLVGVYSPAITLAAINTGATLYDPQPRGSDTLLPIAEYPFEHWRKKRGSIGKAIAELAVDYAVPDISRHVIRVERRQHGCEPVRLDFAGAPAL